ncbi:MAG: hypothetical protein VKL39_06285 [Leptolyngbyaceae bacterium]|nr:hypothetical protein [Leptolyngbyaceae bacterium]
MRNPTQADFDGIVGFPYVNHNLRILVISEDVSGNQLYTSYARIMVPRVLSVNQPGVRERLRIVGLLDELVIV